VAPQISFRKVKDLFLKDFAKFSHSDFTIRRGVTLSIPLNTIESSNKFSHIPYTVSTPESIHSLSTIESKLKELSPEEKFDVPNVECTAKSSKEGISLTIKSSMSSLVSRDYISINDESEAKFIEEEHPFPSVGRHIYREMGEWDPSRIDANEYAIPLWNSDIETIRLRTVFQSKEEAQTGLMAYNVDRLRKIRTKDSNQKSFKLVCRSNADVSCLWKARVNKARRHDDLWEVTEWTDQHTCMQQVGRNDQRNVTTHMISNLIINKVQKKVEYNVNMVQANVTQCWKVDVSYKKAWHGRKKAIECVYGSWESNFAELP
ncbi:Unknown protein, partial [Striga hermonthica]